MFDLHENESGSFQELAHASDVKFGQLSVLKINPGYSRGGHYHTRKEEWFCCIHGKCELRLNSIKNGSTRSLTLAESCREFALVKPFENHVVVNPSKSEACELLVIISEAYDENDPDTFRP
jgi:UDP-2-acetamido-2,6-beta-L-arabino-hexul-4-ose reductase